MSGFRIRGYRALAFVGALLAAGIGRNPTPQGTAPAQPVASDGTATASSTREQTRQDSTPAPAAWAQMRQIADLGSGVPLLGRRAYEPIWTGRPRSRCRTYLKIAAGLA